MRTAITPIFTAIVLVSLSATSLAVEVSNVTTGALLFQSNGFENDQVGTAPAVTSAGTWGAENYPNVSTVITGTAGGAPGALSGSNYLQTVRLSSGDAGNPTANFANQSTAGEQIHAEYMMYLPQNNHSVILIMNGSTEYWRGLAWLKEQSFGYYNGSQYVFTPNAYPVDKWFKVEIDYAINDLNYQVKLDGVAMPLATTLNGITNPGGGDLAAISIGHNGAGTAYVDAVPEPASLALLACGGLGLLARRRRKV